MFSLLTAWPEIFLFTTCSDYFKCSKKEAYRCKPRFQFKNFSEKPSADLKVCGNYLIRQKS